MDDSDDGPTVSRRTLLRASVGTVTVSAVGAGQASATDGGGSRARLEFDRRCPDATLEPSHGHCEGASMEGCADDHPATVALREAVQESLAERYPDAGALVEEGYKPYFDTLDRDADGWSHWINPEYVGDDSTLDPDRPESVLVDNETWRSIGVMFIATRGGEPVGEPPAVYEDADGDGTSDGDGPDMDGYEHDGHDHGDNGEHDHGDNGEHDHGDNGEHDGPPNRCAPWHYHAGLPGRFAWWYYRKAYEDEFAEKGLGALELPCRTPCMMHVWAVDHPEGVYAHGGPPREYRHDEPAKDPDFDTDAEPGSDELNWDAIPDDLEPERRPNELAALVPGL